MFLLDNSIHIHYDSCKQHGVDCSRIGGVTVRIKDVYVWLHDFSDLSYCTTTQTMSTVEMSRTQAVEAGLYVFLDTVTFCIILPTPVLCTKHMVTYVCYMKQQYNQTSLSSAHRDCFYKE